MSVDEINGDNWINAAWCPVGHYSCLSATFPLPGRQPMPLHCAAQYFSSLTDAEAFCCSARLEPALGCVMLLNRGAAQRRVCRCAGCEWGQLGLSAAGANGPRYPAWEQAPCSSTSGACLDKTEEVPVAVLAASYACVAQVNQLDNRCVFSLLWK